LSEEQSSISVSLSEEEKEILSVKAESYGLTIEEYIREILSENCLL